ncbi:MAG: hypothetical protein JSU69_03180 [Candidatus Zixiibacteriota bacterium]|nr:MAG: hypothetical protein JSU69_03180 [candidate division Zixibacteria bacterium]
MKSSKPAKKTRKQLGADRWEQKERERLSRLKKNTRLKKKQDWRDLLMEVEDFLHDR